MTLTLAAAPRSVAEDRYLRPLSELSQLASHDSPAASQQPSPIFGSSMVEQRSRPHEVQREVPVENAIAVDSAGPSVVGTETPEGPWLAWCQSAYLGLLGDDGLGL